MITADIEILRTALSETHMTSHRQALLKQIYRLNREASEEAQLAGTARETASD